MEIANGELLETYVVGEKLHLIKFYGCLLYLKIWLYYRKFIFYHQFVLNDMLQENPATSEKI